MMPTLPQFRIGDTIGDYVILEDLGVGGAGQVFKVEHTITRRREAMKVVAGGTQSAREGFQRFLREIQLHAALGHPNIAEVHNAFWSGEALAMVMELLEGEVLERLMARRRIPMDEGVAIARQLLGALAHAHAYGIIHCNISPSNIYITDRNKVKLTDLGLATMVEDLRATQCGASLGSFHYMSPEQVRGNLPLDARTDIYSCGVVLYEILTGRKPFNYDNAFSLMRAQVEQQPLPPFSINPMLPPELNYIVLRALAKNPEERFPSATAFRDALDALDPFTLCLASVGVVEEPDIEEKPARPSLVTLPKPTHSQTGRSAGGRTKLLSPGQWQYAAVATVATILAFGVRFGSSHWGPAGEMPAPSRRAPEAVLPVQPVSPSEPLPTLDEASPVIPPLVAPAAAIPLVPSPMPAQRTVAAQSHPDESLPPPVVHNASPTEPVPEPMPIEAVPIASPVLDTPPLVEPPIVDPHAPTLEPPIITQPQPVISETVGRETAPRPKGLRGFFGRLRGQNTRRGKPGKDDEKANATSSARDASKL